MKMGKKLGTAMLAVLVMASLVTSANAGTDSKKNKVQGAWKIVEISGENERMGKWSRTNIQPSVIIFTNKYYSVTYVQGDVPRPLMAEDAWRDDLTPEQAHSVWRYYTSNSGKCKILPKQIKTYPLVALWPNFMEEGSERIYHYKFEGEHLLLSVKEEDASFKMKLKRLP